MLLSTLYCTLYFLQFTYNKRITIDPCQKYKSMMNQQQEQLTNPNVKEEVNATMHQLGQFYKLSLCRFYLRGNCPLPKQKCSFAHGITDLRFVPYDPVKQQNLKQVYYDFRINHPINQLDQLVSESQKNYINLYQFQSDTPNLNNQTKVQQKQLMYKDLPNLVQVNNILQNQQKQSTSKQQLKMSKQAKKRGEYEHKNNQKKTIYNPSKQYTLSQINQNRILKIQIRKKFHQNQFRLFLELIQTYYSSINAKQSQDQDSQYCIFSYEILQLEYFRVGFNKLMTRIKLSFLIDYLLYQYKGSYFKLVSIMPPYKNKTITYYLKMCQQNTVFTHYKNVYQTLLTQFKNSNKQIRQQDVRNAMIRSIRQWRNIPPILELLRIKHCTFKEFFIRFILERKEDDHQPINLDWVTDQSIQIAEIHKIIEQQIKQKQFCIVSTDILAKSSKFSKALVEKCIQDQRNECENRQKKQNSAVHASQKLILFRCPNIKKQIITKQRFIKPQAKYQHTFGININILIEDIVEFVLKKLMGKNQFGENNQEMCSEEKLLSQSWVDNKIIAQIPSKIFEEKPDNLNDYKIIDICSAKQLQQYSHKLLNNSTILGVDLQGSLTDQSGYLSLLQINHYSQKIIFLIDYLTISKNESQQGLQICRRILLRIFNDNDIVKIIHDSRNDAECLYNLLKNSKQDKNLQMEQKQVVQLKNIFDTAASQQIIQQIQDYNKFKNRTPSLNQVLKKYGQLTNHLKQKYHGIWAQGKQDPSLERPMPNQFKQYCSMDVLGLPKVYTAMSNIVNPYFLVLISQMHADWSQTKQKQNKGE